MSRSTRMLEIIQLLRNAKSTLTARALAENLEVAPRTIYRDIAVLQSMRVPIEGEAGVGYVMRPGYDLPPLMFTTEEVEAIAIGMEMLSRTSDRSLQRAAGKVVDKIAEVLPADCARGLSDPSVYTSRWHTMPDSALDPRLLRQAAREERTLQITYCDDAGERTTRTILPLAVIYYTEVIVLAAWCELRSDFRHFRLDRIRTCGYTGDSFPDIGSTLRTRWRERHQPG